MNSSSQTALHLASQAGLLPAVRLLLDAGADVNQELLDNKGACKTALDLVTDSGNQSCRKLLLLWGGAPAEARGPQRASSLPNLAAEIAEEGVEDKADEEDNEGEEEEDNAHEVRVGMDQELCQRVKEMQNELSELRRDVLRLRKERSEVVVIEAEAKTDDETEVVIRTENGFEERFVGQVFGKDVSNKNAGEELKNMTSSSPFPLPI